MVNKMIRRRLEALEKLTRAPNTIVLFGTIDYNRLFNLEGEKAKPENVIRYLAREVNGKLQCIGAVVADSPKDPFRGGSFGNCTGPKKEKPGA
jgi:hypothetical protein